MKKPNPRKPKILAYWNGVYIDGLWVCIESKRGQLHMVKPQNMRTLAAWLLKAAEWIESKEGK